MSKARIADKQTHQKQPVTAQPKNGATRRQEIERISYSTPIKEVGICSTCSHQSRCLFFKAARQAIHSCEEFDAVPLPGEPLDPRSAASPYRRPRENAEQGLPVGLCANCDTRLTCMHRRPGIEVLQCEDYS